MSAPPTRSLSLTIAIAVVAVAAASLITVVALFSTAVARSTSAGALATAGPTSASAGVASVGDAAADKSAVTPSPAATASAFPPASVAAVPMQVLTIGDSIMKGYGLSPADAWPELISAANGWDLTTLACDGAGFVDLGNPAECGDTLVDVSRSAAALHPDLIIIEGSSNDLKHPNSELLAATTSALIILRSEFPKAEIIGLSAVWPDTDPPAQLADINSQVQQAVRAVGGHYLDIGQPLSARPKLMQDDDIHPAVAGQMVLAAAIQTAIVAEQQAIIKQKANTEHQSYHRAA
jgi:acyl-CoA thioesterase-1